MVLGVWDPCCCGPLQVWCKLIAVYHVVVSYLYMGFSVHELYYLLQEDYPTVGMKKLRTYAEIGVYLIEMLFGVVLGVGAWTRDAACCWTWVGFSALELLHGVIILANPEWADYGLENSEMITRPFRIFKYVVRVPLLCYIYYVVYAFTVEIHEGTQRQLVHPEIGGSNAGATGTPSQSQWSMQTDMVTPTATESEQTLEPPKP